MEITCLNCHHTWQLTSGQFLGARLKFAFGAQEQEFACPRCGTKNLISQRTFRTSDPQRPVTPENDPRKPIPQHPARADNDPASPPTNPVPGPEPNARQVHAIVLEPGLRLLRKHNPTSETMGTIHPGEHIIILDTWTDGKDVWIQLGPERWATIDSNGEALIDLLNDEDSRALTQ